MCGIQHEADLLDLIFCKVFSNFINIYEVIIANRTSSGEWVTSIPTCAIISIFALLLSKSAALNATLTARCLEIERFAENVVLKRVSSIPTCGNNFDVPALSETKYGVECRIYYTMS